MLLAFICTAGSIWIAIDIYNKLPNSNRLLNVFFVLFVLAAPVLAMIGYKLYEEVWGKKWQRNTRRLRELENRCTNCGYHITNLKRCPECGTER